MTTREDLETVERAVGDLKTQQPRFQDVDQAFASLMRWTNWSQQIPPYSADSRARDRWLAENWWREPHWAGMLRNEAALNANRRWTLTGGRNAVARARRVLNQHWVAADVWGHRQGMTAATIAYHTQDLGAVIETARVDMGAGFVGPLAGFLHVDSSQARLTGKTQTPLEYQNKPWGLEDYWRFPALVNPLDSMRGLGLCSTSLVWELVTVLMAVYTHDQEMLGARAPKGLLLLQNITSDQWAQAMEEHSNNLSSMERDYYGGVAVLATMAGMAPEAKLVALSQLPAGFEKKTVVELIIYAMALVLGRDPAEYWPVSGGSFGRSQETAIQHRKATNKAGNEFVRQYESRLNDETFGLGRGVHFEFEARDDEGRLTAAEVSTAWGKVAELLYKPGGAQGEPLLDRETVLALLVREGVLTPDMTPQTEVEVQATDTDVARARDWAMGNERVEAYVAACRAQGRPETIVQYHWPNAKAPSILFELDTDGSAYDEGGRQLWRSSVWVNRAPASDAEEVLYQHDDPNDAFTITQSDVDSAIAEAGARVSAELMQLLQAQPYVGD